MKTFLEIIRTAVECGASEVFILAGQRVMIKCRGEYGELPDAGSSRLTPVETDNLVMQAYDAARRQPGTLRGRGDDQFAISLSGLSRVRISAYMQRNSCAMVGRIIPFGIPEPETIGITPDIMALARLNEGLVLVCGPAESGRSTTLACLVNEINHSRRCHIVTLERPIEYLFRNDAAFVSQREVTLDTSSFADGLRAARRQAPDVLLVSEIGDGEIASEIVTMADNHRLVFSSLQARSPAAAAAQYLSLLADERNGSTAPQLAGVLQAVVCQRLERGENGFRPVFDVMVPDDELRGLIARGDIDALKERLRG